LDILPANILLRLLIQPAIIDLKIFESKQEQFAFDADIG
jgi:hypothetical protein